MVLYRPLYNASGMWVRPHAMFLESVEVNGQLQPRFVFVAALGRGYFADGRLIDAILHFETHCRAGKHNDTAGLVGHPDLQNVIAIL